MSLLKATFCAQQINLWSADDAGGRHQHNPSVHGVHLGEGHGPDGLVAAGDQALRRSVQIQYITTVLANHVTSTNILLPRSNSPLSGVQRGNSLEVNVYLSR